MNAVRKAVIPVAGLGTRFFPIAKAIPKEMLPVLDKPVIHYIVSEALDAGIEQVILVNGRNKSSIEDYFDSAYESDILCGNKIICSIRQKEALGLGHAILCAGHLVGNEPFAVLLGDDVILTATNIKPAIRQLIEAYEENQIGQVAIMEVKPEDTHKYGIVEIKDTKNLQIKNVVEKPATGCAPSNLAIIGRYVLPPSIWQILRVLRPGHNDEIQLTDALSQLIINEGLMGYEILGHRIDAGEPIGLLELNLREALRRTNFRESMKNILDNLSLFKE